MCKHCAVCCKQYFLQWCLRSWQVPLETDCVLAMPTNLQSTLQTATAPFILDMAKMAKILEGKRQAPAARAVKARLHSSQLALPLQSRARALVLPLTRLRSALMGRV